MAFFRCIYGILDISLILISFLLESCYLLAWQMINKNPF